MTCSYTTAWAPALASALTCALLLVSGPAGAQDLAQACSRPGSAKLLRADGVEQRAEAQYAQLLEAARRKGDWAPPEHPQVQRMRYIVDRMLPFAEGCNERARNWKWPIGLIGLIGQMGLMGVVGAVGADGPVGPVGLQQPFAGLPGGRLVVFSGALTELQLDDDELAALLSHAMAESLLEFELERLTQKGAIELLLSSGVALQGTAASAPTPGTVAKAMELRLVRQQALRADRLGLLLAAQAGYRPEAFVSLWKKLRQAQAQQGGTLQRHVPLAVQVSALEREMPSAAALFLKAQRPDRRFSPPAPAAPPARPPASAAAN